MSNGQPNLSSCGCCQTAPQPATIQNRPGLSALVYRVGTYATFFQEMLAQIHAQGVPDNPAARPLAALTTRSLDDPSIALLDAWSVVADVLTFYQERIANEGFLRTAIERRSVLELARAIGYELSPGVAASVYLAFTVDDTPGAPGNALVPKGTRVQSVPPQNSLPQTFETSADVQSDALWNALKPRMTRPQDLAVGSDGNLYMLGVSTSFPDGTPGVVNLNTTDVYLLNNKTALDPNATLVTAVPISQVFLQGTNLNLKQGDRLLVVGKNGDNARTMPLIIRSVVDDAALNRTQLDIADNALPPPFSPIKYGISKFPSSQVQMTSSSVQQYVLGGSVNSSHLNALLEMNNWQIENLYYYINNPPPPPLPPPDEGVFALRQRIGFFGHNAPKYDALPAAQKKKDYVFEYDSTGKFTDVNIVNPAYPQSWEGQTIWKDSQGNSYQGNADVYLERSLTQVLDNSWALFEAADGTATTAYRVAEVTEASLADYGLSGKTTGLKLSNLDGSAVDKTAAFSVRSTSAFVQSEQTELADLPIDDFIPAGTTELMLDGMAKHGIQPGQPVALTGVTHDPEGVPASEVAILLDVVLTGGFTSLVLESGLQNNYIRSSLTINANVVLATNGETVDETLGSGDASQINQTFTLKRPPLTYVSAPTPSGAESTLAVRVNNLLWNEQPSLYGAGPQDESYIVRLADDGITTLTFGDGVVGERLPTGQNNVTANYRTGIGLAGNVGAGSLTILQTRPLGIRGVTNPQAANGGADRQDLAHARVNAPLAVLTLDRIVSLEDYESFARAFAGIGKAQAIALWSGESQVAHITVAAANGGSVDPTSTLYQSLVGAIDAAHDPVRQVVVAGYQLLLFNLTASVQVDAPRYVVDDVLAAVTTTLQSAFSFSNRAFAQPVTAAEVVTAIQQVPGVIATDLTQLYFSADPNGPTQTEPPPLLPSAPASWQNGAFQPAQLLLINVFGLTVTQLTS